MPSQAPSSLPPPPGNAPPDPSTLLGLTPMASHVQNPVPGYFPTPASTTWGQNLTQAREAIGRTAAAVLGVDYDQMAENEKHGIRLAMAPFLGNLFHGTQNAFSEFSPNAATAANSLYGPGHYFTDNPEVASEYAQTKRPPRISMNEEQRAQYFTPGNVVDSYGGGKDRVLAYNPGGDQGLWSVKVQEIDPKTGDFRPGSRPRFHSTNPEIQPQQTPNVRVQQVRLSNPFAVTEPVDPNVVKKLEPMVGRDHVPLLRVAKNNDQLYSALAAWEGKADANMMLQEAGFDGIAYPGGRVRGGKVHNAYVVFDTSAIQPPAYPLKPK